MLVSKGVIHTDAVIRALQVVDRGFFIDPPNGTRPGEEVRYYDMPFRNGAQHLSAPGIYGVALEALDLADGMSFLNVCAGTGYISAVASQILGTQAVHTAIELRGELVRHAREKLHALGLTHVDFRHGSCLEVDPATSMRFQRIYFGAGADESVAATFFNMLEIGGVLVGPFASSDGSQRLLRVRRLTESSFQVGELMWVQFTPLLVSLPHDEVRGVRAAAAPTTTHLDAAQSAVATGGGAESAADGASHHTDVADAPPGRSTASPGMKRRRSNSISLAPPEWSVETHARFPAAHRRAVRAALLVHANAASELSRVPHELLLQEILPKLEYAAFGPAAIPDVQAAGEEEEAATVAEAVEAEEEAAVEAERAGDVVVSGDENDGEEEEEEEEEEDTADDDDAEAAAPPPLSSSSSRTSTTAFRAPGMLGRAAYRMLRCL